MHYPHAPHRSNYFTCYRRGDWKVIYHYYPSKASEGSHYQLYHLRDDPFEQNNLAESKSDQLNVMMQGLAAALEQHGALCPVDKTDATALLKPRLP
jgi:arylsulfatase A-like enzyme